MLILLVILAIALVVLITGFVFWYYTEDQGLPTEEDHKATWSEFKQQTSLCRDELQATRGMAMSQRIH